MASFFFYSNNAPDAKIVLNRGTQFELDISNDVRNFNTSNDINSIFGNFTVVVDNTNDKHVDRFGKMDMEVMSSIEIFVKSNIAAEGVKNPRATNPLTVFSKQGQSLNSLLEETYNLSAYSTSSSNTANDYRSQYIEQISRLNGNRVLKFANNDSGITGINVGTSAIPLQGVMDLPLEGGQLILMPPPITHYKRVFLGVVENVSDSFSAGSEMVITLTGESVGYWLRATNVNISPAVNELGKSTSIALTAYANKYSQSQALEIFSDLIKVSSNDLITVTDYTFGSLNTSYENVYSDSFSSQNVTDVLGEQVIDTNGNALTIGTILSKANPPIATPNNLSELLDALTKVRSSVKSGTMLNGIKISNLANQTDPDSKDQVIKDTRDFATLSQNYNIQLENYKNTEQAIQQQNLNLEAIKQNSSPGSIQYKNAQKQIDENSAQLKKQGDALTEAEKSLNSNGVLTSQLDIVDKLEADVQTKLSSQQNETSRKILKDLGIIDHWQKIFSNITLEVANAAYLRKVYPFKWLLKSPQIMDGDYQPKANIGKQIADALNFEFYMDTNGHFVVKPPLYNIGVPDDDPTYVIEQEDLISMNLNESVDGIITRIGVTGDVFLPVQLVREQTYNSHSDFNLINKYGVHNVELQNLIFLRTPQDCKDYGETFMAKNNQELRNASITIMGRPDIRLGVAIYLKPRDTVYYIKSISHDFSVGNGYTTTLNLIGARKIITGFRAKSSIVNVAKTNIGGIDVSSNLTNSANSDSNNIEHFIQANTVKQKNLLAQGAEVNDNIGIIRNSYTIISHPNPGYVGLLVSQDSVLLQQINSNAFTYIYSSCQSAEKIKSEPLKNTYQMLQTNFGNNITPFTIIKDYLLQFLLDNNVGGASSISNTTQGLELGLNNNDYVFNQVAKAFNQAILNKYFSTFTNELLDRLSKTTSVTDIQNLNAAGTYFNQMIVDAGVVGSYRQYTDQDGREYPITLDYGKGLKIENASLKANEISAAQTSTFQSAKTQNEVNQIIEQAKKYAGLVNTSQATVPGTKS